MADHVIFSLGLFSTSVSAQCTGWRRTHGGGAIVNAVEKLGLRCSLSLVEEKQHETLGESLASREARDEKLSCR